MSNNNRRRRGPRPEGAPAPTDYQASKSAAQAEAEGVETVSVAWRGLTFTVPARPETWPYWTVTRFIQTDMPTAVSNLLGARQLSQVHARYPDITGAEAAGIFGEIFQEIAKAAGFGNAGN